MDDIFLTTDATFYISVKTIRSKDGNNVMRFAISDGGPYKLRTATGREYGKIQQAYIKQDIDTAYAMFADVVSSGIPEDKISKIHPDLVWLMLAEVLKRSRVTDEQRGK